VAAPHVPLSVLDLAPVGEGSSPAAALQASLVVAQALRLGLRSYLLVAEAAGLTLPPAIPC
jgi:hypothetical protein